VTAAPVLTGDPGIAPEHADLLEVKGLTVQVQGHGWAAPAVDDISFSIGAGEIVGLVGESGSGKSLTALSILGLVQRPVSIAGGSIMFDGRELVGLPEKLMRRIRGAAISMIFQEPTTSLDAAFTIGDQLVEAIRAHRTMNRRSAEELATKGLERVGIASAGRRLRSYPYEFSGGMRQRVMIAMALLLRPKLLLADEPTTALDVTTQAQILELIMELQREMGLSVLLISHDLGAVLDVADRVVVMYAGRVVEEAPSADTYREPQHPYTQGLLRSKLSLRNRDRPVAVIDGQIPGLQHRPTGCRFEPRCIARTPACAASEPELVPVAGDTRFLRCFNPQPWVEP
jgi:oligopeptide/dipeptide ABC transporter ATP-binding protein